MHPIHEQHAEILEDVDIDPREETHNLLAALLLIAYRLEQIEQLIAGGTL